MYVSNENIWKCFHSQVDAAEDERLNCIITEPVQKNLTWKHSNSIEGCTHRINSLFTFIYVFLQNLIIFTLLAHFIWTNVTKY